MFSPRGNRFPSPRNSGTYRSSVFSHDSNDTGARINNEAARSPRQRTSDTYRTNEMFRNNLKSETSLSSANMVRALQEGNRSNRALSPSMLSRSARDVPSTSLIRDSLFNTEKKSDRKMADNGRKSPVPTDRRPDWEEMQLTSPRGVRGRQSPNLSGRQPLSPRGVPVPRKQPTWEGFHSPRAGPSDLGKRSPTPGQQNLEQNPSNPACQQSELKPSEARPQVPTIKGLPAPSTNDIETEQPLFQSTQTKDELTKSSHDAGAYMPAQAGTPAQPSNPRPAPNAENTSAAPESQSASLKEGVTSCSRRPLESSQQNPLNAMYEDSEYRPLRRQSKNQSRSPGPPEAVKDVKDFVGIIPGVAGSRLPVKQLAPDQVPPSELPHQASEGFKLANGSQTVPIPPPARSLQLSHQDATGFKHRWQSDFTQDGTGELRHQASTGWKQCWSPHESQESPMLRKSRQELPHCSSAGASTAFSRSPSDAVVNSTSQSKRLNPKTHVLLSSDTLSSSVGAVGIQSAGRSGEASISASMRSLPTEPLFSINELKRGAIHPSDFHAYLSQSEKNRRATLPSKLLYAPEALRNGSVLPPATPSVPLAAGNGYSTGSSLPVSHIRGFPQSTQASLHNSSYGAASRKPYQVPGISMAQMTTQVNSPRRIPVANTAMATLGGTPRQALPAGPSQ